MSEQKIQSPVAATYACPVCTTTAPLPHSCDGGAARMAAIEARLAKLEPPPKSSEPNERLTNEELASCLLLYGNSPVFGELVRELIDSRALIKRIGEIIDFRAQLPGDRQTVLDIIRAKDKAGL